jgi:iron complex outermembrane recepter protein
MGKRRQIAASMTLATLWAAPALAQEDQLSDIVVTAQRREQSLQQVPLSVTAIDGATLERARIEDLTAYAALVPNFKAVNYGNPGASDVSIRGVSNIGGQSSSIAVYNDEFGVSLFDFDLDDVERVEVLRGPQGTLFGRNTIAGAVNIIYNKPTDTLAASAYVDVGRYDTYKGHAMLNLPLVDDRLYLRGNVTYARSDGFIRDIGPGKNRNDYEKISGRIALRALFGPLTIDASYAVSDNDQGIQSSVSTGVVSGPVAGVGILEGIDNGQGFYPANTNRIATDQPTTSGYRYATAMMRATYDLGPADFVLIAGRQTSRTFEDGELDRTTFDFVTNHYRRRTRTWNAEARIESHGGEPGFSYLLGGSIGKDRERRRVNTIFTADFFEYLGFPREFAPFNVSDDGSRFTKKTVAAFGQLGWLSTDEKLSLELSARYTRDRLHLNFFDNAQSFVDLQPANTLFDDRKTDDDFTPRASIRYTPAQDVSLYATVSRGYKSGGFNTAAAQIPGAPENYGKETATNYEAGIKTEFLDRKVRANLSAFRLDWKNIQVEALYLDPSLASYSFTQNAASAKLTGGELEVSALPFRGLQIDFSLGYADANFGSFATAIDSSGNTFDASGNRLPLSSKWQGAVAAEYTLPVANGSAFGRAEYSWTSGFYQSSDNRREVGYQIGNRSIVNLRAGWQSDRLTISVYGENLGGADKARIWNVGNFLSGYQAVIWPERYGVRVGVRY